MTKSTYKLIDTVGFTYLERTDPNGKIWAIPIDEANSDYQAYLNPVEHLTEIVPVSEAAAK